VAHDIPLTLLRRGRRGYREPMRADVDIKSPLLIGVGEDAAVVVEQLAG
jgi:hypothetical protein